MNFEDKIEELFLDIPEALIESESQINSSRSGNLLFLSGVLPYAEGRMQYKGRVGLELNLDAGKSAAKAALIQALAVLRKELKSLNKIKKIVNVKLYIATGAEFKDHKKVFSSCSNLLQEIFGGAGKPSFDVIGCASLPENAACELSLIVEVK